MDQNLTGWYTERSSMWPGQAFSLQVKRWILQMKTQFQTVEIFESTNYGKVLALDGVIQLTERDESAYQEMIAFLPLNSHPNPKKVLIIGGGDGGVAREVSKHPLVETIVQCEIDAEVIEACKTHIPSMGCGFNSPKLRVHIGDGAKFIQKSDEKFDVIIADTSDPMVPNDAGDGVKDGPAASLFCEDFYCKMKDKLTDKGVLCCQGENMWLHASLISELISKCQNLYPVVTYAYTCTPTYPSGQIGFILCSKDPDMNLEEPCTMWTETDEENLGLKYYNTSMHRAAFVLPTFMRRILKNGV